MRKQEKCTASVPFVAIIFIFFEKKWSSECRYKRIILCTAFSKIAANAIQHNIRRNYLCSKIVTNGFFPLIAIDFSKTRSYCDEWDNSVWTFEYMLYA